MIIFGVFFWENYCQKYFETHEILINQIMPRRMPQCSFLFLFSFFSLFFHVFFIFFSTFFFFFFFFFMLKWRDSKKNYFNYFFYVEFSDENHFCFCFSKPKTNNVKFFLFSKTKFFFLFFFSSSKNNVFMCLFVCLFFF